ncbi:uncharacterized protein EKO05_0001471 [Ascochyta rabiei]|uniref:Uncharacterized protein n=1 Tax=Didymella rabiei TaxID=5454 RepID=A0A163CXL8_DIDRA|nr:uncharacterized protein EKO05_0001471 [Ascochyta rabiei]KZM22764.1 hypothetical protein ST47_g6082 [Ascochyta rabiei]UPX10833.1 hypothetical protein EKO05_0001471 [Ascochyta rabiei]
MADTMQTDRRLSLPGTEPTDQQMNACDDPRIMSVNDAESITRAPRAAVVPGRDVDMARSATASTLSEVGPQWERDLHQNDTGVPEDMFDLSQRGKNNVKKTGSVQNDGRNFTDSTDEVLEAHTTPKHPPHSRPGSNFTNPTRASLGWQTERHQFSPSSRSPWIPAGSPSVSRPGSANQSIFLGYLSRTHSQTDTRPRRSEGYHSPPHEPEKSPSLLSEANDAAMSRAEEHRYNGPGVAALSTSNGGQLSELDEIIADIARGDRDVSNNAKKSSDLVYEDPLNLNGDLHEELQRVNERCRYLEEDSALLREDIDLLCTAWLTACLAASVSADAISHFHFLVTDSEIDTDSRAAAREELTANELCRWISYLQEETQKPYSDPDRKDELITTCDATSSTRREVLVGDNASRRGSADWQNLFEKEQHRFKSLQAQYKQFKADAERMYQPDLERTCRDLKADLTEAQDRNASLADDLTKAQEEARSWQAEMQQYKEEFERRTEHFDEQLRLQHEEMIGSVSEYQSKVNDSRSWDKDGLILKNKRLEHDQARLAEELSRVSRASAGKDDHIEELLHRHHRDQRMIEDLRNSCFTGNITAIQARSGEFHLSAQDVMEELREKQRQRREDEDAQDALKEKVRRLRMKGAYPPHTDEWHRLFQAQWLARWDADGCLEDLTAAERALLEEMEGREIRSAIKASRH